MNIFSAILWKALLISTDAKYFYTSQIFLYWIKNRILKIDSTLLGT